jgi:polyisoprenoid-binding protein YceI
MCEGRAVNGDLTLHGVTRPFALDLDWGANVLTAMGRLRRADWGMTARPLTGGSTVRITVATAVPPVTAR